LSIGQVALLDFSPVIPVFLMISVLLDEKSNFFQFPQQAEIQ